MKINNSPSFLRKRKMLLVLPVLVLPFLTMIFWSLGGGKSPRVDLRTIDRGSGLNVELPDARFKDERTLNKLGYYEKADYDSLKRVEQLRNDPFYKLKLIENSSDSAGFMKADNNAEKIFNRIAALDKEINQKNKVGYNKVMQTDPLKAVGIGPTPPDENMDRLSKMMESIQQSGTPRDPQLEQLGGMLDKILDIQHPERMNEQLRENSIRQKEKSFPVVNAVNHSSISLLEDDQRLRSSIDTISQSKFYSVLHNNGIGLADGIEAVIHETRTVMEGSTLKLRLQAAIYVDGKLIPAGSFLYGKLTFNGERLLINIPSLRFENSILPVALIAYDMDGLEGISIPGSTAGDASKETSDKIVQSLALNSLNPSVGSQAAGAGIDAVKNLLSKKIKRVRVTVKAGYKVLLKDKK